MIIPYLLGLILYCLAVIISYSDKMKATVWYFPAGLLIALGCNYLWLYIAKVTVDKKDIYINGLIWDSMIVGTYVIIPLIMYGVRFAPINALGIALVVIGLILTKV